MIAPVGAELVRAGAADGRGGLPAAQAHAQAARARRPAVGDEGGFAPALRVERGAAGAARGRDRGGRLPARRATSRSRWTRRERVLPDGALRARRRGPHAVVRRDGRALGAGPDRYPIVLARGRHGRGRLGRLGASSPSGSATASSSSATTSSSPTRRSCARASRRGVANSILIKLNQIGTAHRDARHDRASRATPATAPSSRTAPARPRTRSSPTSSSPPAPARSRPARRPAPSASPSTTSCCASRRSSATRARYAGRAAVAI